MIYPNPSARKHKITGYNIKSKKVGLEIYVSACKLHTRQYLALNEIIDIRHIPSGVFISNVLNDSQLISSQRIKHIK